MFFSFVFNYIFLSGRDQVSVGIVPIGMQAYGEQSALSVFPLAVANCSEESRYVLKVKLN